MDIIHEILYEEEEQEEELSSPAIVVSNEPEQEPELVQDEWMAPPQQVQVTQMQVQRVQDMTPPTSPESSSYIPIPEQEQQQAAYVAPPTIRRQRPSSNITPRGVRRVRGGAASAALLERLKVGMYFAVWYALNIVYNSK